MKKLLALFAASLFALTLAAQEKNFIDEPYIEVTGKAEMEVVPDRIYLRVVINEKDNKGKVSVEQQEKEMFKQLKSIGIDLEKQLSVQDMSSDLQTYFLRKNAILSTKAYQLEVNSAAQLGQAFEALQKAGISDVNIEKTDISNIEELRREIRIKAIQAAQKNAQVLAEAIGQEALWAIYIQDYGFNMRPYANVLMTKSAMTMNAAAGVEESGPALEFEKTKIEHSVMARFVLKTTGWSGRK